MLENGNVSLPKINMWKILLPIFIGASVTLYLIASNFHPEALQSIRLSPLLFFWLTLCVVTIILRDGSFMYKIRLSSGHCMTWKKTFQTIIMWEFGACILPKVSESIFVLFVLKKSGLSYGKSTAVIMLNAFFDNLSYVILFIIFYLVLGGQMLVFAEHCSDLDGHVIMQGIRQIANKTWIGFALILTTCTLLGLALFVFPQVTRLIFHRIGHLRVFSRMKFFLCKTGDDIEQTSKEFKNMPLSFWLKMFVSTLVNWISRYLLALTVISAFSAIGLKFVEVFARQLVLWVFTSIPSTPGSSGVAELSFMALNCEYMPIGLAAAIALLWRIFSYYLYLVIGLILLPRWAKQIVD